jgi:hypothetical protein
MTMALHWFPTARDMWEIPRSLGHLLLLAAGLSAYDILSIPVMRIILIIVLEFCLPLFSCGPVTSSTVVILFFSQISFVLWQAAFSKTLDFEMRLRGCHPIATGMFPEG